MIIKYIYYGNKKQQYNNAPKIVVYLSSYTNLIIRSLWYNNNKIAQLLLEK